MKKIKVSPEELLWAEIIAREEDLRTTHKTDEAVEAELKKQKFPRKLIDAVLIQRGAEQLGGPRGTAEHEVACVMLAGAAIGTSSIEKIAALSHVPLDRVHMYAERFVANDIWAAGKTKCNWLDPEEGGLAFTMDLMVGMGLMERAA